MTSGTEKGDPFQANVQAVNFHNVDREQPRTDWRRQRGTRNRCVLHLIRAQCHVVRREARTSAMPPEFDGVESEADNVQPAPDKASSRSPEQRRFPRTLHRVTPSTNAAMCR